MGILALNPLTLSRPTCVPPALHCHPRGNMTSVPSSAWPSLQVAQPASPVESNGNAPGGPQLCESAGECPRDLVALARCAPVTHSLSTLEPHPAYSSHPFSLLQPPSTCIRLTRQSAARQQQNRTFHTDFRPRASRTAPTAHHDVLLRHLPWLPCHPLPTLAR